MRTETSRLLIRNLTQADAEALHRILADPEVMRYIGPPFSLPQTRELIRDAGQCEPPNVYAVCRKDSGKLIGYVRYQPYGVGCFQIGWVLGQANWRQGYAGELTDALIVHAARSGVGFLAAECAPRQAVSRHIVQERGFAHTGARDGRVLYRLRLPCIARGEQGDE